LIALPILVLLVRVVGLAALLLTRLLLAALVLLVLTTAATLLLTRLLVRVVLPLLLVAVRVLLVHGTYSPRSFPPTRDNVSVRRIVPALR
jgi:hypothetical protein